MNINLMDAFAFLILLALVLFVLNAVNDWIDMKRTFRKK